MTGVVFVTWDGPGQNYLESLFLPIFQKLRARGIEVHVLQFTWETEAVVAQRRLVAARRGIAYRALRVWRRPRELGAILTLARGARTVARYVERESLDVILPRSILPAAMALLAQLASGRKIVFDADGLPPDERVEFAGWSASGAPYRVWRYVEAHAVRRASSVITRTLRAKRILVDRAAAECDERKIFVIPNGRDESEFSPRAPEERARIRERFGVSPNAPWMLFVGSVGPQYCLRATVELFERVRERRSDARLHVLTGQPAAAHEMVGARHSRNGSIWIGRVPPEEVPLYMAAADLGVALRLPTFSQRAVSPIKVAEYLLSGLPVVVTAGVGDLESQLSQDAALILPDTERSSLIRAANWFVDRVLPRANTFRAQCRSLGVSLFSLERCAKLYGDAIEFAVHAESPDHEHGDGSAAALSR
jgi:glycosyltransferase involved in cell wall biosynthesis